MANLDATRGAAAPGLQTMSTVDWVALALMIVGGINWGLVGAFDFDLVAALFGPMSIASRIVYILVGLSALYSLYTATKLAKRAT